MAKHLRKFTDPFDSSSIPFLLAEPLTDGEGTMVDLTLRYANPACGVLLGMAPEDVKNKRFSRLCPAQQLSRLSPVQTVAFGGSTAVFPWVTPAGQTVQIICYQPMYGLAACILDSEGQGGREPEQLPGVSAQLELSREGIRLSAFSQRLCTLTGREYGELTEICANDFSALILPEDRTVLLQSLLDALRSDTPVDQTLHLLRRDGSPLQILLRAEMTGRNRGVTSFSALLLDVDARARAEERTRSSLHRAETALHQLSLLFHGLPCGFCLLRETADGLMPLRVSQGLAALLDEPVEELEARLAADPLGGLSPQDQESLRTAARAARDTGSPLRTSCHLTPHRWGLIEAVRQPQADGTSLLLVACTNISPEKAALSELEFRSRLCDLLLDDPQLISFDYDPTTDVSRIFRRDKDGRRISRIIPEYLRDLERSSIIHPDDQKQLSAAVKRAAVRPDTEVVEYRANYDGQGWRWYRVSWISLFDRKGNIYRLVGKAQDISRRKAAAQRFRELLTRQKQPEAGTLAAVQLDLSGDRILDVRCSNPALTQALFGNTAAVCLAHLREQIPTPEQRQDFGHIFSREALLDAYHDGHLRLTRQHRFNPGIGAALWVETSVRLIDDPESGHANAFFVLRDVDRLHRQDALLGLLARRDYDLVVTVRADSRHCRSYGHPLPEDLPYEDLQAHLKKRLGTAPSSLDEVRIRLERTADWSGPLQPAGRFCWSWLDRDEQVLLLTLRGTGLSLR